MSEKITRPADTPSPSILSPGIQGHDAVHRGSTVAAAKPVANKSPQTMAAYSIEKDYQRIYDQVRLGHSE